MTSPFGFLSPGSPDEAFAIAHESHQPVYINFRGPINGNTVEKLMEILSSGIRYSVEKILLIISSPGGGVRDGIDLYNFLKSLPIELITHNTGSIDSIANVVYLAGSSRGVNPNARFLFHGVRLNREGPFGENDLVEMLNFVRKDHEAIARVIASETRMSIRDIRRAFRSETIYSAEEAKDKMISHRIEELKLPKGVPLISLVSSKNDF